MSSDAQRGFLVPLSTAPGHLLRRAQQVHTEAWARLVEEVTGPQYSVLVAVGAWHEVDQRLAGELASLDKSSVADIVSRLVLKGWLERHRDPTDGRRRLLTLSTRGSRGLGSVTAQARQVQSYLLAPIADERRHRFIELLGRVAVGASEVVRSQSPVEGVLRMETTPGYLLRRAQQAHTTLWNEHVEDLTGPQYAVLASVFEQGVATQAQIGRGASLDSSTVAEVVNRLIAKGWLRRERSDHDRRQVSVRLTAPAQSALHYLQGPVSRVQQLLMQNLAEDEKDDLVTLLQLVAYRGAPPAPKA